MELTRKTNGKYDTMWGSQESLKDSYCPRINLMTTGLILAFERAKPSALSSLDNPMSEMDSADCPSGCNPHMGPITSCFPWHLLSAWWQSIHPSVFFKVLKYYSAWMNDYLLLSHQTIFMIVEARLSSWRQDNAWLCAARQRVHFGGHTNVFSYSHGHHSFFG